MIFRFSFWRELWNGMLARSVAKKPVNPGDGSSEAKSSTIPQELMMRADQAWSRGDLRAALQGMEQALAISDQPDIACRYATLLYHAGQKNSARELLFRTIAKAPLFIAAQTQLSRMIKQDQRLMSANAQEENSQRQALLAKMRESIEREDFFKPSAFWDSIAAKHERWLDDFGIDNFKRTVAHNYQNWLIHSPEDSQWRRLQALWLEAGYTQPLLNTVEAVDDAGFIWEANNPAYPLSWPPAMATYKLATGILWEVASAADSVGFLADYDESLIGNPIRIRRNGRLISQDAAHSSRELNALFKAANLPQNGKWIFAELGAGHGRLAEMVGNATDHRYWIFDIAPTLAVSQWYIQQRFPGEKIFSFRDFDDWSEIEDELSDCRFAFFTANQIRHLPSSSVDVFINICSLMEMRRDQIDYFLERISEVTRRVFMSKQWYEWDNPTDGIHVSKDDFRLKKDFDLIFDQPDDILKELYVQFWSRRAAIV